MRTYRCPECSQPLAAFAGNVPASLPFSETAALVQLDQAVRRHERHCPARAALPIPA